MIKWRRQFEWFIQFTILVSLIVHVVDLHLVHDREHGTLASVLHAMDIVIVGIFTVEYFIRWYLSPNRWRYPFTLMAILDLLVILPFYLSYLLDLRSLRMIRLVRALQLLKFYRYNKAMQSFMATIQKVSPQLEVIGLVLVFVIAVSSTAMFEAERDDQPDKFRNLGDSVWWCIVTLGTVGYGDIAPVTGAGRWIAGITMVIGLGIFGTFISLIGSAFVSTMQEEDAESLTISKPVYRQLKAWQRQCDKPVDMEHLKEHADRAVEEYVARHKKVE